MSDKPAAPYSAPFTTDVPQCCGDPATCSDPCATEPAAADDLTDDKPAPVELTKRLAAVADWIAREVEELHRCKLPKKAEKARAAFAVVNVAAEELARLRAELADVKHVAYHLGEDKRELLAERDVALALLQRMSHMLARYVSEVPLGHQPHMAALDAEALVTGARNALKGETP